MPESTSCVVDIKQVPGASAQREALRQAAARLVATQPPAGLPTGEQLSELGRQLLAELDLPAQYLGFAMVAVDNALWAEAFARVPTNRRVLLLPHCLRASRACAAQTDTAGLHCVYCGNCDIAALQQEAEARGYQVVVAEGTSAVVMHVLEGRADALLGVACLDSLEKSFHRLGDLGIPHQTVPLLTDGCEDTVAELSLLRQLLAHYQPGGSPRGSTTYLPLLRETSRCFADEHLDHLLEPCGGQCFPVGNSELAATDTIAREWLQRGGKRLRPFLTMAAYAVGRHGALVTTEDVDLPGLIPDSVRRLALAIEALHKASLAHDDIEDEDPFRYGKPTLYRTYGPAVAINIGDYLVGLGYRLMASQQGDLGPECVADIMQRLSRAHLQLCCGQGGELLWSPERDGDLQPAHALRIAALKTAPAFFVALYTGLRAAGVAFDEEVLTRFSTHLGEGFQTLNDLENWSEVEDNKVMLGRDVLKGRPTALQAFCRAAGGGAALDQLLAETTADPDALVAAVGVLYDQYGSFARAADLLDRLRTRCLDLAGDIGPAPLQDLLRYLVRNVLRPAPPRGSHPTP